MGLFDFLKIGSNNDDKRLCPICKGRMGLLNTVILWDGNTICESCSDRLRSVYPIEMREETDDAGDTIYYPDGEIRTYMHDTMTEATLDEISTEIAIQQEDAERAKYELGDNCEATFTVGERIFVITPRVRDVGMDRANKLKEKLVVEGVAHTGVFESGDEAVLVHDGVQIPILIIEAHEMSSGGFDTALNSNRSRKVRAGKCGWLIIGFDGMVYQGDIIGKV